MFTASHVSVKGNIFMRQKVLCASEGKQKKYRNGVYKKNQNQNHVYNVGHQLSWTKAPVFTD
jgi:hypothetical protein